MNIRLRFKLIALLIVLSLAGLLVFQGYWLKGLYDTLYKQMEINIEEAMKIADYKELFLRIRAIKKEQGALGPQTQDVYFSSELDPSNKQKMDAKASIHPQKEDPDLNREDIFKTANPDSHMKLHIDYGEEEDFSSIDSTLTDYLYVIGEVEDMVLNIDVPATILDAAGVAVPEAYQGVSLLGYTRGEAPAADREAFLCEHLWELDEIPSSEGIRTERWKYMRYRFIPGWEELYDLAADPEEAVNLASDPAYGRTLEELRRECDRQIERYVSLRRH